MTPEELIAENHYLREQLRELQQQNRALSRELDRMYDHEDEWDEDTRYQGYYPDDDLDISQEIENDWHQLWLDNQKPPSNADDIPF